MLALQIFLVLTVKEPRWLTPSLTNQEVGDQLPEGWLDVKHSSFFVWRNLLNTHGLGIWREFMSLRNKQKLKCLVSALPLIWSKICNYIRYCCKTKYWKLWTIYVQLQHLQIIFFFLFVFVGACYTKHSVKTYHSNNNSDISWMEKKINLASDGCKNLFVPSLLPYNTVLLAEQLICASPGLHNGKTKKLGERN